MTASKPFVEVVWHDAADFKQKGWASEEELEAFVKKPVVCYSRGWLIAKTRTGVTIAGDYSPPLEEGESPDWGRVTKIPKKMVISIREVGDEGVHAAHETVAPA